MLGRIWLRLRFIDGQSWLRFEELRYHHFKLQQFGTTTTTGAHHGTSTSATRCRMAGSLSKSGELIGSSNETIEYNRLIGSREKNLRPFGRLYRHVTPLLGDPRFLEHMKLRYLCVGSLESAKIFPSVAG